MHFGKKDSLFWPLLAIGEMVVILFMVPANCRHAKTDKETPTKEETRKLPENNSVGRPICADGENCPSEVIDLTDDDVNDEADDKDSRDVPQSCATAEDCGCGYGCTDSKCRKLTSACCGDTDCGAGLTCVKKTDELNGTCMLSQCDSDVECDGRCGIHCENQRCTQTYCCVDTDCSTGKFCHIESNQTEGVCLTSQCNSNSDCACNEACVKHSCERAYYSESPMKCCGTDVYYSGSCFSHENIENGNCLGDAHCTAGKLCVEFRCLPATCTDNAGCGCAAICRKGRCERGCDEDSDCCDQGGTCYHGRCLNPNNEDE